MEEVLDRPTTTEKSRSHPKEVVFPHTRSNVTPTIYVDTPKPARGASQRIGQFGKLISNHPQQLRNTAKRASDTTKREEESQKLAEITRRFNAGESLKAVILDVCSDVAEVLDDQAKRETSLLGELSHSQQFSRKIDKVFSGKYGVKHNDSPTLEELISNDKLGEFSITIKKIGETEKNRRVVEAMLSNPELRPIAFADRPKINGKKVSLEAFFNDTYGKYRDSNSIYLNEIKILDEGLYRYLGSAGKHITSTMKKCTDQVTADIAALANISSRAHRVLKSAYGK